MALFNRSKKQTSVLPDEVSQYYQSQRRERTGVALMLGVVALIITLLIGAALFFGGRFVYRQFVEDDKKATETAQPAGEDSGANQPAKGQVGEDQADTTPAPTTPATPGSGGSFEPAPAPTTPSTGDDTTLPRTGDEGM